MLPGAAKQTGKVYLLMRTHQHIWQYFQNHRLACVGLGYAGLLLAVGVLFFGSMLGLKGPRAFAQSGCSGSDQSYIVASGDTLSGIAAKYNTDAQSLASYNQISDPNQISPGETICIPGNGGQASSGASVGSYNPYPQGQCTWWADERYHQLHGAYVPWLSQSDAWQWTSRAREYHWHVSSRPAVGDILNLQPWTQGAYGLGHVAVVEKLLSNGHVLASNMNWGGNSGVTNVEFTPGPGVTFLSYEKPSQQSSTQKESASWHPAGPISILFVKE